MARPRKNPGPSIYWRKGRAYADFRAYADVGGARQALSGPGSTWATTDREIAEALFAARLIELEDARKGRAGVEQVQHTTLAKLAREHLIKKRKAGKTSTSHLGDLERRLGVAIDFFGAGRDPRSIKPDDVGKWAEKLANGKRKPGTVRHYLNALSGLYGRAQEGLYVDPGYNPVALLQEKPSGWSGRGEAKHFEVAEAALLLEAARVIEGRGRVVGGVSNRASAAKGLHAIIATMLLTGGRNSEVLGLDVEDVSFDRGIVYFRPNAHRTLKTKTSVRDVPLWPQLREILQAWLFGGDSPRTEGLIFAAPGGGMVGDLRRTLDRLGKLCGMRPREVRTRAFRHTYCATRLQTVTTILRPGHKPTDEDAWSYEAVSHDAVARELGHGGHELVKRIYGHRARDPHRSNEVAYRVEEHREKLGKRLSALEAMEKKQGVAVD